MTIVWTIIIGFFIGLISRTFTPQRDTLGLVIFVLLGIAGAFIGGLVARVLGLCPDGRVICLAVSALGSLTLIAIYRWIAPVSAPGKVS
jgi:uncharacterized membrane protein YeaQ/YmgE (transglycosylase-associated protein family)